MVWEVRVELLGFHGFKGEGWNSKVFKGLRSEGGKAMVLWWWGREEYNGFMVSMVWEEKEGFSSFKGERGNAKVVMVWEVRGELQGFQGFKGEGWNSKVFKGLRREGGKAMVQWWWGREEWNGFNGFRGEGRKAMVQWWWRKEWNGFNRLRVKGGMEWFKWVERERGVCKAWLPLFERGRGNYMFNGLSAEVENAGNSMV